MKLMKTKLLLIALAFGLMSSTCSNDDPVGNECDCEIGYYIYTPYVGGGGGTYNLQFTQPIDFDCVNETYGDYFPVSNVNYNYAKVECDGQSD
jgi:hypothetical protein